MFESTLTVTEAFGLSEPANDPICRFSDDVVAETFPQGREGLAAPRRNTPPPFEDDSERLFRPFRIY